MSERRGLVLACGLIAAAPILVAAVHAVTARWVPLSDLAYTAVKSFDVLSPRTPLVGQWSSGASAAADQVTYSPGPLLFWLLAIPTRWLGPSAPAVTAGLVNVAAIVGAVALARRRGGTPLMIATAIAIPLMLLSLPAEAYSDPWNSSAPLMPMVLLFFLCWSLACGEYRLLPLSVLVASFAVQSHLTFVVPVALVLGVGLVGLAVSGRAVARPWVLGALAVALLCWIAPLIDQAIHRPGNLVLLARAATTDEPTVGFDAGWHAVVQAVGVVPWWLQEPGSALEWILDLGETPGVLSILTALVLLGALVAVVLVGWRRRRPEVWAAGALGLALAVAVGVDAASTPEEQVGTVSYTLRWAMPAGMCIWLALGWALLTLAPWRVRLPVPRRAATVAGLAAAAAVALAVSLAEDPVEHPYRAMRALDERVLGAVPEGSRPRVESADLFASSFQSGLVFWLRREGREVLGAGMGKPLGSDYTRGDYDQIVRVQVQDAATARTPPGRLIARLPYEQPFAQPSAKVVTVSLLPAGAR